MAVRWILCPVVTILSGNGPYRAPKIALLEDLGKPVLTTIDEESGLPLVARREFGRSNVIGELDWCICFLRGIDFASLEADPDIVTLADGPLDQPIGPRFAQVQQIMLAKGVDPSGLTEKTPAFEFIVKLGQRIKADFVDTRGTWVG